MTRKALILSAGIVASLAGVATAQYDKTWDGSNGTSWADAQNWTPSGVPGATDDVGIVAGAPNSPVFDESTNTTIQSLAIEAGRTLTFGASKTLTVTGAVAVKSNGTIDIDGDAAVLIASGANALDIDPAAGLGAQPGRVLISAEDAELRLTANSMSGGHNVDGVVDLSAGAILSVQESAKFIGAGMVHGQDATALITIASGKELENAMSDAVGDGFRGAFQMTGAGTFDNLGRVEADGGVLEFAGTLTITDGANTDVWESGASASSELRFSVSTTGLTGKFVVNRVLRINQNVTTTGQFDFQCPNGQVVVASTKTFTYSSFTGDCSNPDTDGGPPFALGAGTYNCSCP